MKEFIEYILKQIVSQPEKIKVEELNTNGMTTYMIEVAEEDMGLVIGKQGKTIKSIRSLVRTKAIKDGVRVMVELVDKNPQYRQSGEGTENAEPVEETQNED